MKFINDLSYYVKNLKVLYEDNHLIIVDKPSNVLSQKDKTGDFSMVEVVKEYLKEKYQKTNVYLGLLHRLDRRVSGILMFAKTSKAAARMSNAIKEKLIEKFYLLTCVGILKSEGEFVLKLKKQNNKAIVSDDGKEAVLKYKLISKTESTSTAEVKLITGRYNQIRKSFSHFGFPIVGDDKYSNQKPANLKLRCIRINFIHPVTKEKILIKAGENEKN